MQSETIGELAKAMVEFQGIVQAAKMDTENPFFKSKYADLGSVWEAAKEPLKKCGLAVVQTNVMNENGIVLRTTLMHTSGEWIAGDLFLPPTKKDPQQYGSALTYARRYGMAAILGIIQEDDDGNAASVKHEPKQPSTDGFKQRLHASMKGANTTDELNLVMEDNRDGISRLDAETRKKINETYEQLFAEINK